MASYSSTLFSFRRALVGGCLEIIRKSYENHTKSGGILDSLKFRFKHLVRKRNRMISPVKRSCVRHSFLSLLRHTHYTSESKVSNPITNYQLNRWTLLESPRSRREHLDAIFNGVSPLITGTIIQALPPMWHSNAKQFAWKIARIA